MKHDDERRRRGWFNWHMTRKRIVMYDRIENLRKYARMVSHRRLL